MISLILLVNGVGLSEPPADAGVCSLLMAFSTVQIQSLSSPCRSMSFVWLSGLSVWHVFTSVAVPHMHCRTLFKKHVFPKFVSPQ